MAVRCPGQEKDRVYIGAQVDRGRQRDELIRLARRRDRSVSSIIRRALAAEPNTYKTYEAGLDKLARHFADLELEDFEPSIGTERLEEFLDHQWGFRRTAHLQTKNLSIVKDFFKWAILAAASAATPHSQSNGRRYSGRC